MDQDREPPDRMLLEKHGIALVLFLPKIDNLILIIKKPQTKPNQGTFYKMTACNIQKSRPCQSRLRIFQTEGRHKDMMTKYKGRF